MSLKDYYELSDPEKHFQIMWGQAYVGGIICPLVGIQLITECTPKANGGLIIYKKRRNTMLYVILLHTTKSNNIKLIDFAFLVEITSRNNIISKYLLRTKYFFSARLKGYLEKAIR